MTEQTIIRVLTQGITDDSLDPMATIRPSAFAEQRDRYIQMAVDAVRAAYPDADVDTEPGNGLQSVRVYSDGDEGVLREDADLVLMRVYEDWCETVPAEAQV